MVSGFVLVAFTIISAQAGVTEDFARAGQYYSAKAYDSALAVYRSIEQSGVESAELNFNIGNCYFKSGDIGRAVAYYLRAKRLNPSDDDIKANLAFARGFTRIQMEGVQLNPVYSLIEGVLDPMTLNGLAWISSALFILFFVLLTLRLGFGLTGIVARPILVSVAIALAVFAFSTTFKYRHDYLVKRAVVIAEDCPVLAEPTLQARVELHGAPGLVVEVVGQSGDYYSILFENKRRGWIAKDRLEIV